MKAAPLFLALLLSSCAKEPTGVSVNARIDCHGCRAEITVDGAVLYSGIPQDSAVVWTEAQVGEVVSLSAVHPGSRPHNVTMWVKVNGYVKAFEYRARPQGDTAVVWRIDHTLKMPDRWGDDL